MKLFVRFLTSSLSVVALTMAGVAQTNDQVAAAALANSAAGYGDVSPIDINQASQLAITSDSVFDARTGLLENNAAGGQGPGPGSSARAVRTNTSTIDGMDSLVTFDGAFITQAGKDLGKLFRFTMMGNHPLVGGTTNIPAPIATVDLKLLNEDGTTFAIVPFAPFESVTLQSPNFNFINYRSGNQIQYADAVHRAQFYNRMAPNWHTTLVPNIVDRITFTVPKFVLVRNSKGDVVKTLGYASGLAADGSRFVLMLNLVFNSLFSTGFINEINNGNFTTDALSTLMLPNTFLYSFNEDTPLMPGSCCVLGFHTYFRDLSAVPQPRFVGEYASWISPKLFGAGFQDVTALSHEISEAFADPFVDNATAKWQFAGVGPNDNVCQANLEEGDPIETLSVASIPITIKEKGQKFVYHPQVIPLLQWFEMGPTSNAIDGAFSFPDETTLPHSALPCPK